MTAGATVVTVSQYLLCRTRAPAPFQKKFPVFEKRKFCTFFNLFRNSFSLLSSCSSCSDPPFQDHIISIFII
jgi:hypothetical protein